MERIKLISEKTCYRCKRPLPLSCFSKCARAKDGRQAQCKECARQMHQTYTPRRRELRAANKEKINEQKKADYQKHRDKRRSTVKKYREAHRNQYLNYFKEYYKTNKGDLLQAQRERRESEPETFKRRQRQYYEQNKESYIQKIKAYRERNIERVRFWARARRLRERSAQGVFTREQWEQKCEFWGWACYLCRAPLTFATMHIEHRKPVARGGSNWIANLAPACRSCNAQKHAKTEREYREQRGLLLCLATPAALPI